MDSFCITITVLGCLHPFGRAHQWFGKLQTVRHEITILRLFDQCLDLNDREIHDHLLFVTRMTNG